MTVRYYGIPGKNAVKYGDDADNKPAMILPARTDLVHRTIPFAWGHVEVAGKAKPAMVEGAATLAIALCAHALADDARAVRVYQRFKMRVMDKWKADDHWSITVAEIAAACDQIEADAVEIAKTQKEIDRDRPLLETEYGGANIGGKGGVVWHTDEHGRQIPIKEE